MAQTIPIDDISDRLVYYIQSGNLNFVIGSGASYPAIPLAGSIEAELDALVRDEKFQEANVASLQFIQSIEAQNDLLILGVEEEMWGATLEQYSEFLHVLDRLLFRRKSNLLPRQANIFTTNYDTFFEEAAGQSATLILNDGFDRASSLTGSFRFAPERYFDRTYRSGTVYTRQAEVPTLNLIKLHGSLTWRRTKSGISFSTKSPKAINLDEEFDHSAVEASLAKRALILPNFRKHGSTVLDRTYYDLIRLFANCLESENALLIAFGFSFCDEHLRDVTLRALRNPTSQMIVFAYDAVAVSQFEELFEGARNIIIVAPGETNTDFSKFSSTLASIIAQGPAQ